jgi:hypothetical protein
LGWKTTLPVQTELPLAEKAGAHPNVSDSAPAATQGGDPKTVRFLPPSRRRFHGQPRHRSK